MPIKGLSEVRQMDRLGKIHLGIKVKNANGVEYPRATDYFVCPPEVQAVFGEKPTQLDIMLPVEDETKVADQFYRCYSNLRGLLCKGDGDTCTRLIDTSKQGDEWADRETATTVMKEGIVCQGQECPKYKGKKCKEMMMLRFLLPDVPGFGVWQIDTSSYHGIVALNSSLELIRALAGRISMIPLTLKLVPREVTAEGKKKTIHVMQLTTSATLREVQKLALIPPSRILLPPLDEADVMTEMIEPYPELTAEEKTAQVKEDMKLFESNGGNVIPPRTQPPAAVPPAPQPVSATPTTQEIDKDFGNLKSATEGEQKEPTPLSEVTRRKLVVLSVGEIQTAMKQAGVVLGDRVLTAISEEEAQLVLAKVPAKAGK